jgi:hypothetical protein
MKREEAIAYFRRHIELYCVDGISREAEEMAIKALEQEPVLDKIRAEIKALSPEPTAYDVVDGNPIKDAVWETLSDVLKIIDKYRESEGIE